MTASEPIAFGSLFVFTILVLFAFDLAVPAAILFLVLTRVMLATFTMTAFIFLRACSKSSQQEVNEGQNDHLLARMQRSLTVLP